MIGKIFSIYINIIIAITLPLFFLPALLIWLLTVLIDKRLRLLHLFTCFWGAFYIWVMPIWRVKKLGKKNYNKKKKYIIVCNHQSQLDILVTFSLFIHFKIVSKAEIFKIPFMGWNMRLNRYIKLIRGDSESIKKMMNDCLKNLKEGNSVFIYPEGTRSIDGNMKKFKAGAFILAKEMKVPILPIVLNGTGKALPKKHMKSSGFHDITVKILEEIPFENFENLTVEETSNLVRDKMISELDKLKINQTN